MSANPVARPQSRRAFIGALAALPAGAATAAHAEEEPDAELLAWADRLDVCRAEKNRLRPSQAAASARWVDACERAGLWRKDRAAEISDDDCRKEMARLAREVGFDDHPIEAVEDEIEELGEKIIAATPKTIAGLAAKARLVAWHFLKEEDFTDSPNCVDWDRRALRTFMEDLCGLAGFDIHAQAGTYLPRKGRKRS